MPNDSDRSDSARRFPSLLPEQLVRLTIVVVAFLAVTIATWAFVIPPSLKDMDLHRAATVSRERDFPVRYAGAPVCRDCHEEENDMRLGGFHRNLSCETCHGPLYDHTEDPLENPAEAPRGRGFCPICHTYDASRPTGFPQIDPILHNPRIPCTECHAAHDPEPPEIPHECGACHAQIVATKSFSPHALLECTVCHEAPEEHRVTPRLVRPTTPRQRAFCGQCHSTDSEHPRAPKVDIATHEEKYLCWQCHYPHMPETT